MGVADVMLGQVRSVSSVPNGQVDSCRGSCFLRSMHYAVRVGTHWSGAQYPRDSLFKGGNIQEHLVGDTWVGDTSTLHQCRCNVSPPLTDVSLTENSWMLHPLD